MGTQGMYSQVNGLMVNRRLANPNGFPFNYPLHDEETDPYDEARSTFDSSNTEQNR